MDNALMIGLQTQRVLQRRMDATANNLANVATNGFKSDAMLFEMMVKRPASSQDTPHDVRFVEDAGITRDMSQGSIQQTGSPFDVAINGDGFFMVQGPNGTAYTRDGAFTLAADGTLVTQTGRPVLSQGGSALVFDPQGEQPTIDSEGAVTIAGVEAGRLGVTKFANPEKLEKIGDNLFEAAGQPGLPSDAKIVQNAIEGSNVKPVVELTRLIEISRAYESAAKIVQNSDDLRKSTIQRLGGN
jgi:flagellar basal-body rod protein FlgF